MILAAGVLVCLLVATAMVAPFFEPPRTKQVSRTSPHLVDARVQAKDIYIACGTLLVHSDGCRKTSIIMDGVEVAASRLEFFFDARELPIVKLTYFPGFNKKRQTG